MEELKDLIESSYRVNYEQAVFIPETCLRQLLNKTNVLAALQGHVPCHILEDVADAVLRGARKVFAILVLDGHAKYITKFLEADNMQTSCLDEQLPFDEPKLQQLMSDVHAAQFWRCQWKFCPPTLFETVICRSLQPETILPFRTVTRLGSQGSFGIMSLIEVDATEHHIATQSSSDIGQIRDSSRPTLKLVGKMVPVEDDLEETPEPIDSADNLLDLEDDTASDLDKSSNDRRPIVQRPEDVARELENLALLKCHPHPNVLRLLACYKYRNGLHFIFLQARDGDLKRLLTSNNLTPFVSSEACLVALAGLASGLAHIHNYVHKTIDVKKIGCHYDLKPDNILVDGTRLIIADFGLSKFRDEDAGSSTMFKQGKGFCLPPECQELEGDMEKHAVRRSSDVWSLGCILADVLTYMHGGAKAVKDFEQARAFRVAPRVFRYFHKGDRLHDGVIAWFSKLERNCPPSELLLLALIRKMLEIRPHARPSAVEVQTELEFISLYSLSTKVSSLYEYAEQSTSSARATWALNLEKERFEAWRYVLGLADVCYEDNATSRRRAKDIPFEKAVDLLQVKEQLFPPTNLTTANRFTLPLRNLNSELMQLLDTAKQREASQYVEMRVSATNNIERLSLLGNAPWMGQAAAIAEARRSVLKSNGDTGESTQKLKIPFHADMVRHDLGLHCSYGQLSVEGEELGVLVEYKPYDHHARRDKLERRMHAIASQFGTPRTTGDLSHLLRCRGWFHLEKESKFGLVFEYPTVPRGPSETLPMVTNLHTSLQTKKQASPLATRFILASRLASALQAFHRVGWLHKSISSHNVAFFYSVSTLPLSRALSHPHIIGFMHSRPNTEQVFTEGPAVDASQKAYAHPQYLENDEAFKPVYDYYSLGLVLLEIGLWKTLEHVEETKTANEKNNKKTTGPVESRHGWLVRKPVPSLRQRVGQRYEDVVKACLTDGFEADGTEVQDVQGDADADVATVESRTQLKFERLVLEPLYELSSYNI